MDKDIVDENWELLNEPASDAQIDMIKGLMVKLNMDDQMFSEEFGTSISKLTREAASEVISQMIKYTGSGKKDAVASNKDEIEGIREEDIPIWEDLGKFN